MTPVLGRVTRRLVYGNDYNNGNNGQQHGQAETWHAKRQRMTREQKENEQQKKIAIQMAPTLVAFLAATCFWAPSIVVRILVGIIALVGSVVGTCIARFWHEDDDT